MRIKKILNNNCIIGTDNNNRECVVMGNGVAFDKKRNDQVNPNLIEKIFISRSSGMTQKLSNIVTNIPVEYIKVTDEIINKIRREEEIVLDDLVYLSICDHIAFSVQRIKDGQVINFTFLWEVKNLFPKEYKCGVLALEVIEKRLGIKLPEAEAGFIAIHVINANGSAGEATFKKTIQLVQDMLAIIKNNIGCDFDETAINYQRLLTHLRFFAKRVLDQTDSNSSNMGSMYAAFLEIHGEYADCIEAISKEINLKYNYDISDDEKLYLLIHLQRCLKNN